MRVRWSLLALRRVSEVVDYISADNPKAAREWADGVFAAVKRLERFAAQGRVVPEVGRPSIREVIYGDYRLIYKMEARAIGVLTVRHGRRRLDPREVRGRLGNTVSPTRRPK